MEKSSSSESSPRIFIDPNSVGMPIASPKAAPIVDQQNQATQTVAQPKFEEYKALYDQEHNVTYLVRPGVEIADPQLMATIGKLSDAAKKASIAPADDKKMEVKYKKALETFGLVERDGKLLSLDKEGKYADTGKTPEMIKAPWRNAALQNVQSEYEQLTEGMRLNEKGTLEKPYSRLGKTEHYDTGMTPESLKAVLHTASKTEATAGHIFKVIDQRAKTEEFLLMHGGGEEGRTIAHRGEYIATGAGGVVTKVWDMTRNEIVVMKESLGASARDEVRGPPTEIEAANLRTINPNGAVGIQEAPYLTFKLPGGSQSEAVSVGFLTKRYDNAMDNVLGKINFSTNQVLEGAFQLFSGIQPINEKNAQHLDIKTGNVFIQQTGKDKFLMHVADFDQTFFMDDAFFETFADTPQLGAFSDDSVGTLKGSWLQRTATSIHDIQRHLKLIESGKKSADKNEIKQMKSDLEILKNNYRKLTKDLHTFQAGHLLYQLLSGKTSKDVKEANFDDLEKDIKNRKLPESEVKTLFGLLTLAKKAMDMYEEAPPAKVTAETKVPQKKPIEELLKGIQLLTVQRQKDLQAAKTSRTRSQSEGAVSSHSAIKRK